MRIARRQFLQRLSSLGMDGGLAAAQKEKDARITELGAKAASSEREERALEAASSHRGDRGRDEAEKVSVNLRPNCDGKDEMIEGLPAEATGAAFSAAATAAALANTLAGRASGQARRMSGAWASSAFSNTLARHRKIPAFHNTSPWSNKA